MAKKNVGNAVVSIPQEWSPWRKQQVATMLGAGLPLEVSIQIAGKLDEPTPAKSIPLVTVGEYQGRVTVSLNPPGAKPITFGVQRWQHVIDHISEVTKVVKAQSAKTAK